MEKDGKNYEEIEVEQVPDDVWRSEEEIKAWVEQDKKHRTSGTFGTFKMEG